MSLFDSVASAFSAGGSTNPTTFKIKVGGKAVEGIINFQVEYVINRIPLAYITISDGDVAKQDFEKSAMDSIAPGKKVEVSVGYESLEATVFKGVVTSQSISISRAGSTSLQLVCKDVCYKMTMGNFSSYYYKVTDNDIFDEVVGRYSGIKAEVSALSGGGMATKYASVVQHNMSDWDFLLSRAEQAGYYIRVSDGTIEAAKPKSMGMGDLKITYGKDIIDMQLDLSSESIYSEYKANSWDDESLEILEEEAGSARNPDPGSMSMDDLAGIADKEMILRHGGKIDNEQLKSWASARKMHCELSKMRGTITIEGNAKAVPGGTVQLKGLGDRFSGTTMITGVSHELRNNVWYTHVQVGTDPEWHFEKFKREAAADQINAASIRGLQSGIVKQIHDDEEGRERILVNLPLIDEGAEGVWMRWVSPDASESKGMAIRPDVGDEVIVGFLNNDANQGVVLGSMYSKTRPGSELLAANEQNNKKGWVVKTDLHLIFDTENDIIEVKTPAGVIITISDQDKKISIVDANSNEVVMDNNGIEFTSSKDFKVSAQGDIKMEGMNIELTAQTGFKAKGTTTELNGSGMTTIKGNPVKIN